MQRLGIIPETMCRITPRAGDSLARCIRDIEDAQSLAAASPASSIGQIFDRLERDFRVTFAKQKWPDDTSRDRRHDSVGSASIDLASRRVAVEGRPYLPKTTRPGSRSLQTPTTPRLDWPFRNARR
jgi:hypothetical protein